MSTLFFHIWKCSYFAVIPARTPGIYRLPPVLQTSGGVQIFAGLREFGISTPANRWDKGVSPGKLGGPDLGHTGYRWQRAHQRVVRDVEDAEVGIVVPPIAWSSSWFKRLQTTAGVSPKRSCFA